MTFHVEDVPRYETPNPYGYNEAALVEKTRVLKELAQLYPDVNPLWREWVYDVCANLGSTGRYEAAHCDQFWKACQSVWWRAADRIEFSLACITKDHARTKSGAQRASRQLVQLVH